MDPERIHAVFISSTFEDLRSERAEVQKAVLRLNCLPIGMELFPSADEEVWRFIQRQIERCDYYLLIVSGRYGSVDTDGLGYTEKEYRFAKAVHKPCLVFIRRNLQALEPGKAEQDPDTKAKLADFIHELKSSYLAQEFETHHELGGLAYYSLDKLRKERPAPGYVRNDEIDKPADERGSASSEPSEKDDLLPFPGYDEVRIRNFVFTTDIDSCKITFGQLFLLVAHCLTQPGPFSLYHSVYQLIIESTARALHAKFNSIGLDGWLAQQLVSRQFPREFVSKRLIQPSDRPGAWKLTPYGEKQYEVMKKIYNYDPEVVG